MIRKRLYAFSFFAALVFALFSGALMPAPAAALSGSEFNPGRIIDDGIFFNSNAMSVDQIQAFISAKVPQCDTNGTKLSSHWNASAGRYYTRAEWGSLNGNPTPFTCLKDYRMDVPSRSPDTYCSGAITGGNKSAAQLISEVGKACSINPQVILVLLQKEQSLVTDDWPWRDQYTAATGFACPDTASCDPDFAGLFNQIYYGARQYQRYAKQASSFNYRAYTSPYVLYNPNTNCGGTNIYIHNQATAGLYNYTPYQPNQAALNNLYGTGDGCSAYGNRNFWRLFSDWFGSTKLVNANIILSKGLTTSATNGSIYNGETLTASYEVSNTAAYDIYAGGLGICARLNGQYYDLGFIHHKTIPAHGSATISFSKNLGGAGTLSLFTCSYNESIGGWASSFYPYSTGGGAARTTSVQIQENPFVTSSVSLSPANPVAGQPVTASFSVRNTSPNPIKIGGLTVAARSSSGSNVDFPLDANITIPANSTYTYSKSRTFTTTGSHSYFVASLQDVWHRDYPKSVDGTISRQGSFTVKDNPLITTGINLSPANPGAGQPVTASLAIHNASPVAMNIGSMTIAARDPSGRNVDFAIVNDVVIPANGTYTYSQSRVFTTPGKHSLFIANWKGVWRKDYPKSSSGSVVRQTSLTVMDNPLITEGIVLSPTNPTAGQSVTATVKFRNTSASPVNIGSFVVAARDPSGRNVDFAIADDVTVPANGTYTYSKSRTFTASGKHNLFIANWNKVWSRDYPKSLESSVVRQSTLSID